MNFQLTTAGKALLTANPHGVVITSIVLGDGYNYNLPSNPTGLVGNTIFTRTDNYVPAVINANTVRYSLVLDETVGTFQFGEIAAFVGSTLLGQGVSSTLITKQVPIAGVNGNSMRFDLFFTNDDVYYYSQIDIANSDNNFRFPSISLPDNLQPPTTLEPNTFVISGLLSTDMPYLAYVDNTGQWAFSNRPVKYYSGTVSTAGLTSVSVATPHGLSFDTSLGNPPASAYCIHFLSGQLRGYVRELNAGGVDWFGWNTPTNFVAAGGDLFIISGPGETISGGGGSPAPAPNPVHLNEVLGAIGNTTQIHGFNQIIWKFGVNSAGAVAFEWDDYNSTQSGTMFKLRGGVADPLLITDSANTVQFSPQASGKVAIYGTKGQPGVLGAGGTDWLSIQTDGAWEVNGDAGTATYVLTSQGSGATPIWAVSTGGSVTVPPHNELSGLQGGFTSQYSPPEYYHVSEQVYIWTTTLQLPMVPTYGQVLTYNGASWGAAPLPPPPPPTGIYIEFQPAVTGTTHTVSLTELSQYVPFTSATAVTIRIPSNANVPLDVGFNTIYVQANSGQLGFTLDSGVVLLAPTTNKTSRTQESTIFLVKVDTDTWRLSGDLSS